MEEINKGKIPCFACLKDCSNISAYFTVQMEEKQKASFWPRLL
jgi:hypothetical protein